MGSRIPSSRVQQHQRLNNSTPLFIIKNLLLIPLDYARSFGQTLNESLKKQTKGSFHNFTIAKSWYPIQHETREYHEIKKIYRLPFLTMKSNYGIGFASYFGIVGSFAHILILVLQFPVLCKSVKPEVRLKIKQAILPFHNKAGGSCVMFPITSI